MREAIYLWEKGEYSYPFAGEFRPNIRAYLHEDGADRPAMLVVPGGGYAIVSPTEGEIVAKRFYEAGYQAFVLTYTTNMFRNAPVRSQALEDISRAVCCIRSHAQEWHVVSDKIACCGFSAGGHLVASLAVHHQEQKAKTGPYAGISNRPDAVVLCYPVITSGEKAHRDSFHLLLGEDAGEEELAWASLEDHVTADTPPTFLWHTITDDLVPVENSIYFAQACRLAAVPCELHLFMEGPHGMSLATPQWAEGDFGADSIYTMEQQWRTLQVFAGQQPESIPEEFKIAAKAESLPEFAAAWNKAVGEDEVQNGRKADASAAQWPALALAWLERIFASKVSL